MWGNCWFLICSLLVAVVVVSVCVCVCVCVCCVCVLCVVRERECVYAAFSTIHQRPVVTSDVLSERETLTQQRDELLQSGVYTHHDPVIVGITNRLKHLGQF